MLISLLALGLALALSLAYIWRLRGRMAALAAEAKPESETPRAYHKTVSFFNDTLDHFPAAVYVLDASGRLLTVNEAAQRLSEALAGTELVLLEGRWLSELADEWLPDSMKQRYQQALAGETLAYEFREKRLGAHFYMNVTPVYDGPTLEKIFFTLQDVTARQAAEALAQRYGSQYLQVTQNYPGGLVLLLDAELNISLAFGQELASLGLSPSDLQGHGLADFQLVNNYPDVHERHAEVLRTGQQAEFVVEWRGRRYVATLVPLKDGNGVFNQLMGVYRRVPDGFESTAELRTLLERYRLLAEHFPRGFIFILNEKLCVRFAAGSGYTAVGHTPQARPGFELREFHDADGWARLRPHFEEGARGRRHSFEAPHAGNVYDVTVVPLPTAEAQERQFMAVYHDISERVAGESMLAQASAEREVLLHEVHHRIRNNLALVAGLLEMQADNSASAVAEEALREATRRVLAMATLHETLAHTTSPGNIRFDQYIGDVVKQLEQVYEAEAQHIEVVVEHAEQVHVGLSQAVPLALLASELITNAWKHAFKGRGEGHITVRLGCEHSECQLEVQDDGVGLAPADAEPDETGAHLGMTLVQGLARQLGGRVKVESEPGAGTSFQVSFPLYEQQARELEAA